MELALRIPGLIEPVPITDDFVQGIAKIELLGTCARFILFSEQSLPEADGKVIKVVVRKIVIPVAEIPATICQANRFMTERVLARVANVVSLTR